MVKADTSSNIKSNDYIIRMNACIDYKISLKCLVSLNFLYSHILLLRLYISETFKKWIHFLKVHGIMNTPGLVQSKWGPKGFMLTLQENRSIHDSMNLPKIEFITYIYILYYQSSINFQFSHNLACFPNILN